MPIGNQSRSDTAPRAEETRSLRGETNLVAMAHLIGAADVLHDQADTTDMDRRGPFHGFRQQIFTCLNTAQYEMLGLIPDNVGIDLMILAGFTSMMAEQIKDFVPDDDSHQAKVCAGIVSATLAISATLAGMREGAVDDIVAIYPELGRSIRRDVMILEARRAAAEDHSHG